MKSSSRTLALIIFAFYFNAALAGGKLCELIAAGPEAMMKELVRLNSIGQKDGDYDELLKAYKAATELSDADLTEAIALQSQMAQINVSTKRPGEGPATEEDIAAAQLAYQYAKDNALLMQAAFMKAIKALNEPVVRGFLVISRQQNNICKDISGYGRFCKELDLKAGWDGTDFFLTAADRSLEIALLLAAEDITVPIENLDGKKFGSELALKFIQEGAPFSFEKALNMKDDAIALALLQRGDTFTANDMILAIQMRKMPVVEMALSKFPPLASAENDKGRFPLSTATAYGQLDLVKLLLKTYKVDVNQQSNSILPAIFTSVTLTKTDIFYELIEAGANLKATKDNGWNLLMNAIRNSSYQASGAEYVRELILAGVSPNSSFNGEVSLPKSENNAATDIKKDWTALSLAQSIHSRGSTNERAEASKVVTILTQNGAK